MQEENYLPNGYILKDYKIEQVLGAGGFGVTYLATDINLDTKVVIKEFLPREFSYRQSENFSIMPYTTVKNNGTYDYLLKKFVSEARILASIKHPNIVHVFSFFRANNTAYFVMDYIEGESLKSYIKRKGALDENQIQSIIIPILEGLRTVHEKRYLHRDIAPDNIYLRKGGMPMLIDFGAAKNAAREESSSLAAIVKAGYSAPEQYIATSEHTPATDIYGVGSVIYTMMSGKVAPESTQRQIALLNNKPDTLIDSLDKNYQNRYSKSLIESVKKAMSIKEKDRFQNSIDMQESIMQDEEKVINPDPNKKNNSGSWVKNSVIALLLSVIGVGVYIVVDNAIQTNKSKIDELKEKNRELKKEKELAQKSAEEANLVVKETVRKDKVKKLIKPKRQMVNFDEKKSFNISHDNINLTLSYNPNIKRGEKVYITASLRNNGKVESRGGITLSFPQISNKISGGVVSNDFNTKIKTYDTSDKIWSKDKGRQVYAKYLMVESNDEKWEKGEKHSFHIAIDVPRTINQFKVQVRAALRKRVVPGMGVKDQQGYPCKIIIINVVD